MRPIQMGSHLKPIWRAVIEIAFIVFLFYSNLLMGEFTVANGRGKSLAFALNDIFTNTNFVIAAVSALIGYVVFECLRKRLSCRETGTMPSQQNLGGLQFRKFTSERRFLPFNGKTLNAPFLVQSHLHAQAPFHSASLLVL